MDKIILGITGPMASGKGTVADYLKEKHGAVIYKFSTPLRNVLDRLYLEQSRQNMQDISTVLRKQFGEDLLAKIISHDVEKDDSKLIVVDGIRRLTDIKYLNELPEFHLISITADQKLRWERITQRGENPDDANKTFEEFQQNEQAEAERQIAEVVATAKLELDNNNGYENLYQQIENILKKINENKG